MIRCYAITPVPAPRMVQSDKWQSRAPVERYRTFRDLVQLNQVWLPVPYRHVVFVMPMPVSWTPQDKARTKGKAHTQRPDRDNLEKALLDSVLGEDAMIWDGRTTKIWGERGMLVIADQEPMPIAPDGVNYAILDMWWRQAQKDTRVPDVGYCGRRKSPVRWPRHASTRTDSQT